MSAEELINFLNTLKNFVPGYWRGRIEEVIMRVGGQVRPPSGFDPVTEEVEKLQ